MMTRRGLRIFAALTALLTASVLTGCGSVKAWQKEHLADPIMSFDEDSREAA